MPAHPARVQQVLVLPVAVDFFVGKKNVVVKTINFQSHSVRKSNVNYKTIIITLQRMIGRRDPTLQEETPPPLLTDYIIVLKLDI